MRMPMLRQKDDAAAPPHADDVVSLDRDLTFMDEPAAPAMVLQLGDIFPDFMANGTKDIAFVLGILQRLSPIRGNRFVQILNTCP